MFIESSSSTANQTAATFPATRGTTVAGSLLIAFQATYLSAGSAPTVPSGWTLLDRQSYGTIGDDLVVWYKVAGGGEPASYTFNNATGLSPNSQVWIISMNGATAAPEVSSKNSGLSGTTATALSVTTLTAGDVLLGAFATVQDGTTTITPNAFDADFGTLAGSSVSLDLANKLQAAAGASGSKTATLSNAVDWGTMLVAIAPAGSPPPPAGSGSGPLLDAQGMPINPFAPVLRSAGSRRQARRHYPAGF